MAGDALAFTPTGTLQAAFRAYLLGDMAFLALLGIQLAVAIIEIPKFAYAGALLVSITQVAAMAGDALTFTPTGTLQAAFRAYLLGDMAFLALLGTQLAVAGMTATAIAMPRGRHRVHFGRPKPLKSLR